MKSTVIAFAFFFSTQAFAAGTLPGQTFCVADAEKGRVTLQETAAGVEIHLFDVAFKSGGTVAGTPVGYKFDFGLLVNNKSLQQVTSSNILKEALVSLLYSAPDEGDRDMAYAYANDFIKALQCK